MLHWSQAVWRLVSLGELSGWVAIRSDPAKEDSQPSRQHALVCYFQC
jgi:hypothetical protein